MELAIFLACAIVGAPIGRAIYARLFPARITRAIPVRYSIARAERSRNVERRSEALWRAQQGGR